jgi:hypothetical protein
VTVTDDRHALVGAYALDALPGDEQREFEHHLETCSSCRDEVREFRDVCADLTVLTEEVPPASLRANVLAAIEENGPAATIQWATRELLSSRTRQDVVDTVLTVVDRLGGWTVPADLADDRALPLDVGLGGGDPLLPAAELDSRARHDLAQHLPQLVEDARQTLETVHRTERAREHEQARERRPGAQDRERR